MLVVWAVLLGEAEVKYEIVPTLYYRVRDDVEEGAEAALGEKRSLGPM